MADNYSLDDILAEVDRKRANRSEAAGQKQPDRPAEKAPSKDRFSVTDILAQEEIRSHIRSEKPKPAEKAQETPFFDKREAYRKKQDSAPEKAKPAEKAQETPLFDKRELYRKKQDSAPEKAKPAEKVQETILFDKKKAAPGKSDEILFSGGKKQDKPQKGLIPPQTPVKHREEELFTGSIDIPSPQQEEKPESREESLSTGSIELEEAAVSVQPKSIPESPSVKAADLSMQQEMAREKSEEKRRREKKERFERELELEDPDDLIDAINPMEVPDRTADVLGSFMSGDTVGLAGNDLKRLAGVTDGEKVKTDRIYIPKKEAAAAKAEAETPTLEHDFGTAEKPAAETAEVVRTYVPKSAEPKPQPAEAEPLTERKRRSNTAFLEKLNASLAKQREAEQQAQQTLGFEPEKTGGDPIDKIKAPENGLNLDYSQQIIQATGTIPTADSQLIGKIAADRKKRSIRDFVMDEDETEEEEEEQENGGVEFDSYDTTGQIWADLCESHKGLKTRFLLLLILTVLTLTVSLFNDLGQGISLNLFGMDISFMNKRADPQGFIFFNLIAGVIGMACCSTLMFNGISKLFKGKADCDSVCAVTGVIALLVPILHLTNFDYLQRSRAYIYIGLALTGLLFNTAGKLMMIVRAKQNFRFVSGDSVKYSAALVDENVAASQFTKGLVKEIPYLAVMRKTEFLTDFLHNSYCEDSSDRVSRILTPVGLIAAVVAAVGAYFMPNGAEGMENNIFWASTVMVAMLSVLSPLSVMFAVNIPLSRAGKALAKNDSVVLGYKAAEEFADVNAVMVDASVLFPAGCAYYTKIKHCKHKNSINNINVDQAIILAGSLAIKSGSVLSKAFRDTIVDRDDILVKVENCIYEDNMGVLGWYGNKRLIMGNREHMLHHDIRIPEISQVNKQLKSNGNGEVLYLAVAGELVLIMLIEMIPNNEIKACLQKLVSKDVSIAVKTTDSMVTVAKIAEVFDIDPEYVKILPASAHEQYAAETRYVSRGDGAVSCNGTFTSFARALLAAKSLLSDIGIGTGIMLSGAGLGAVCTVALGLFAKTELLSPAVLLLWNLAWFLLGALAQHIRKY